MTKIKLYDKNGKDTGKWFTKSPAGACKIVGDKVANVSYASMVLEANKQGLFISKQLKGLAKARKIWEQEMKAKSS